MKAWQRHHAIWYQLKYGGVSTSESENQLSGGLLAGNGAQEGEM